MLILKHTPHLFRLKNKSGEVVSFTPNKVQVQILNEIENQIQEKGKARLIIVKGRQQGITTLMQLLALSYVMSTPAFNSYTMAHDATIANDIFDQKIKFAYENIDPIIKQLYSVKRDNIRQLVFEDKLNNSNITVGLSARSTTQNFLHISEAGKMSINKNLWNEMISGSLPAAEQAMIIAIESTADGGLGVFYEMVQASLRGENEFKTIFLSWTDSPEYQETPPDDDSWMEHYKQLATRYKLYSDPMSQMGLTKAQFYWYYKKIGTLKEEIKVQYPLDLQEAFVSQSTNKFDVVKLKAFVRIDPIDTRDNVKIWRKPDGGQIYILTIDTSSGLGEDYTGIVLRGFYPLDNGKIPQYATMKAKVQENPTADIAIGLAEYYSRKDGRVLIAPEVNFGTAVLSRIRDIHQYPEELMYKRYIQDPSKQYDTLVPDYGFKTTAANRDKMINEFVAAFDSDILEINDQDEIDEAKVFVWSNEKKRYEALQGHHDDLLMADFINLQAREYVTKYLF